MADEPQKIPLHEQRPVSAPDFQQFVAEKGLERPCVECGTNVWNLQARNSDGTEMFLGTIPDSKLQTYVGVYSMYCENCGIVKFVDASVVITWRDKRG